MGKSELETKIFLEFWRLGFNWRKKVFKEGKIFLKKYLMSEKLFRGGYAQTSMQQKIKTDEYSRYWINLENSLIHPWKRQRKFPRAQSKCLILLSILTSFCKTELKTFTFFPSKPLARCKRQKCHTSLFLWHEQHFN